MVAFDEEETTFRSTATVTINIKDTNDNSPVFPEDTYKLSIAEHSAVDTVLETITVSSRQQSSPYIVKVIIVSFFFSFQ